jgi:hypothetical protein
VRAHRHRMIWLGSQPDPSDCALIMDTVHQETKSPHRAGKGNLRHLLLHTLYLIWLWNDSDDSRSQMHPSAAYHQTDGEQATSAKNSSKDH